MADPRAKLILQASLPYSVFSFEERPDNYDKLVDNLTFGFVHDARWNVHPRGLPAPFGPGSRQKLRKSAQDRKAAMNRTKSVMK